MSPLIELNSNWKFVAIVFAVTLYVTAVSFDMLTHWKTKRREDVRLLVIGVGVFALLICGLTSNNVPTFMLNFLFIGIFILAGLLASRENFDTSKKPVELYFVAIGSLIILFGSVVWWFLFTESGQYVREKGEQARDYTVKKGRVAREYGKQKRDQFSDWRENRRQERNMIAIERGRKLEQQMADRSKMAGEMTNPLFERE